MDAAAVVKRDPQDEAMAVPPPRTSSRRSPLVAVVNACARVFASAAAQAPREIATPLAGAPPSEGIRPILQ